MSRYTTMEYPNLANGVRNVGQDGVVPAHVPGPEHVVVMLNADTIECIPLLGKPQAQLLRRQPYDEHCLVALHRLFR
ncbi:unnamed protein product [Macrosiphum euphorbiae]|uniref:Uncharacterized protein n=1 Tax=Macrosiphum euphorbiae TaxID=13131 RepID=A0AAV0X4D5_9HEMI|nr:unnamed protein product [Macrosiphum euphorbiae]